MQREPKVSVLHLAHLSSWVFKGGDWALDSEVETV